MAAAISSGSIHIYEKPARNPVAALFDVQIQNNTDSRAIEPRVPMRKVEDKTTVPVWVFVLVFVICMCVSLSALSLSVYTHITPKPTQEAVAFHATLGTYGRMLKDATVAFSGVDLNLGGGYSGETGIFTVPAGGAGVYSVQLHLLVALGEAATFQVRQNGRELCRAVGDNSHNGPQDAASASCAATALLEEGDELDVMYDDGTDDSPLIEGAAPWNSFTGFRVTHH